MKVILFWCLTVAPVVAAAHERDFGKCPNMENDEFQITMRSDDRAYLEFVGNCIKKHYEDKGQHVMNIATSIENQEVKKAAAATATTSTTTTTTTMKKTTQSDILITHSVPSIENCSSACSTLLCPCVGRKEWEREMSARGWTIASNGLAYNLSSDVMSYNQAKTTCDGKGARIASTGIRKGTKKSVLGELFINVFKNKTVKTWIGLRGKKLASSGFAGSKWSDGVDFSDEHTPWMKGSPNGKDGEELCLTIWNDLSDEIRLNDWRCRYSNKARNLCEKMCSPCTM